MAHQCERRVLTGPAFSLSRTVPREKVPAEVMNQIHPFILYGGQITWPHERQLCEGRLQLGDFAFIPGAEDESGVSLGGR